MIKYICGIILILCIGCKSGPDIKDDAEKDSTIKKVLFWFWVVS